MRIEYDPTHDLLNIEFISEVAITESAELDGVGGVLSVGTIGAVPRRGVRSHVGLIGVAYQRVGRAGAECIMPCCPALPTALTALQHDRSQNSNGIEFAVSRVSFGMK